MPTDSELEGKVKPKRINLGAVLLSAVAIISAVAACLAIPGMPKLFHFDKADTSSGGAPRPSTGLPPASQPANQPRPASPSPSVAPSAPPKTRPSTGGHTGSVTQRSTGNNSPNINGVGGDVNLNYGNSQQVTPTEPKK